MRHWTVLDFVSGRGTNEIFAWIKDQPVQAQTDIHGLVRIVEGIEKIGRPYSAKLKGSCSGLIELRIIGKVQYRPIGFVGPGKYQITLLVGATERDGKFSPPTACETAFRRLDLVMADPQRRTRVHEH